MNQNQREGLLLNKAMGAVYSVGINLITSFQAWEKGNSTWGFKQNWKNIFPLSDHHSKASDMSRTVSILGCGWLGLPLAKHLLTKGFRVKGSVTSLAKSADLARSGVEPYRLILKPERAVVNDERFFETDILLIAIPPRRIEYIESVFAAQINQLIPFIEKYGIKKVMFISSTSVYNEDFQVAQERNAVLPLKSSGRALLIAEELLQQNEQFNTTVIRFGGLIGYDRNPARFLSRKRDAISGLKPVNLIHQDDCVEILTQVIQQNIWGETFNACCPKHPSRKEFYQRASEVANMPLPLMTEEISPYKLIDSSKLIHALEYVFKYENPMDYLAEVKHRID